MTVKSSTVTPTKAKKVNTAATSATATGTPTSAFGASDVGGNSPVTVAGTPAAVAQTSPPISGFTTPGSGFVAPAGSTTPNSTPSINSVNSPGTAGSLGNNSGYNQGTTDPVTGAMAGYGYTPQGLGTLYNNPVALATQILQGMGINNPGLAQQLSQTLDPAVAANFLLNNGQNMSDNDTLNFANQYMQQQATPNGRTVDFGQLVNHLLGSGGDASNPLGAYLNSGLTPDQQVSAGNALFGQTLGNLNPYAQQGLSRYAKDQGSAYQGAAAQGDPNATSYIDYLNKQSQLGQWAGRG